MTNANIEYQGEGVQTVFLQLPGNQATGDDVLMVAPCDLELIDARAAVVTAPATQAIIYDVDDAGGTTRIDAVTIAASKKVSGVVKPATAAAAFVEKGTVLVVDTKQVGSGTAGADGVVQVRYRPIV